MWASVRECHPSRGPIKRLRGHVDTPIVRGRWLIGGWLLFILAFTPVYWISTYFAWTECNTDPGPHARGCGVYRWAEAHDDGAAAPLIVLYAFPLALGAIIFVRKTRRPVVLRTAALVALAYLAFSIVVATQS